MARTDTYDPEAPVAISDQLTRFLVALDEPPRGAPALKLGESLQVWTVPLIDFRATETDHAIWQGVWHHQVRSDEGTARLFARSREGAVPKVQAVYRSSLAEEIDSTFSYLDNNLPWKDDAYLVRLLEIPELELTTLWISREDENRYVPLGRFASAGDQRSKPISDADLKARLPERQVIGLSDNPPPNRRPDF